MAWHSKWHNIKHKKAAADAKKSKVYTKIWKIIEMAARSWANPALNPSLEAALQKAKYNSVPKEVIERAIKKWSWQNSSEQLEEVYYEWYGPGWVAMYIKCITSNKNRTSGNVRSTLSKLWANMWEPGSVWWQFSEKWIIYVTWKYEKRIEKWKEIEVPVEFNIDELEAVLLDLEVLDYQIDEDWVRIVTSMENFVQTRDSIDKLFYKIVWADLEYIPENYISLSEVDSSKLEKLIDMLEEDDDVDTIFHNAE